MTKLCVCEKPSLREERSNGGDILAIFCGLCTRPIELRCPKCKRDTKDLQAHFRESVDCFAAADPVGFKDWKRTITGREAMEAKRV